MVHRYWCSYCNTVVTKDQQMGRKQHSKGNKHQSNVRNYWVNFLKLNTQIASRGAMEFAPKSKHQLETEETVEKPFLIPDTGKQRKLTQHTLKPGHIYTGNDFQDPVKRIPPVLEGHPYESPWVWEDLRKTAPSDLQTPQSRDSRDSNTRGGINNRSGRDNYRNNRDDSRRNDNYNQTQSSSYQHQSSSYQNQTQPPQQISTMTNLYPAAVHPPPPPPPPPMPNQNQNQNQNFTNYNTASTYDQNQQKHGYNNAGQGYNRNQHQHREQHGGESNYHRNSRQNHTNRQSGRDYLHYSDHNTNNTQRYSSNNQNNTNFNSNNAYNNTNTYSSNQQSAWSNADTTNTNYNMNSTQGNAMIPQPPPMPGSGGYLASNTTNITAANLPPPPAPPPMAVAMQFQMMSPTPAPVMNIPSHLQRHLRR